MECWPLRQVLLQTMTRYDIYANSCMLNHTPTSECPWHLTMLTQVSNTSMLYLSLPFLAKYHKHSIHIDTKKSSIHNLVYYKKSP